MIKNVELSKALKEIDGLNIPEPWKCLAKAAFLSHAIDVLTNRIEKGEEVVVKSSMFQEGGIIKPDNKFDEVLGSFDIKISSGEMILNKKGFYGLQVSTGNVTKCFKAKNTRTLKSFLRRG